VVGGTGTSSDGDFAGATHGALMVAKLNATGDVEWGKRYGGSFNEELYFLSQTQDGGYIFYGVVQSGGGDISNYHPGIQGWEPDSWIVRLSKTGSIVWQRCYGGSGVDWPLIGGYSIFDSGNCNLQAITHNQIQFPDGSFYFTATTDSKDGDVQGLHLSKRGVQTDIWVVQLYPDASINQQTITPLGVMPNADIVAAYPNPFIHSTTVQFRAWESAKASVDLYDLHGKLLKTIWKGNVIKGRSYQAILNEATLQRGTYIFVITNGVRKESGRVVKME
jgi:hypothetical protein